MRLLLDTYVVLWQLSDSPRLKDETRDAIGGADELFFSVVSWAEIGIKVAVGKLSVPDDLRESVARTGVRTLPLDISHGLGVGNLPMHHRDPFDRLLISQALAERLTIVSADRRMAAYPADVLDAS